VLAIAKDQTEGIVKRLLDLVVLYILNNSPQTGYSIRKHLSRMFSVKVSFGTLYPHLHDLEKQGLVEGNWVPHAKSESIQKKEYIITDSGKEYLKANVQALVKMSLMMQFVLAGVKLSSPTPQSFEPALDFCAKAFRREGYNVETRNFIRGVSGSEHQVDIFAQLKTDEEKEEVRQRSSSSKLERGKNGKILVEFCADTGAKMEDFIKVFLKAHDLGADKAVIVSVPEVKDPEILKIGDLYNIGVFGGNTPIDGASEMWSHKESWLYSYQRSLIPRSEDEKREGQKEEGSLTEIEQ
jgi:DNA-binding PadR family transcriptional regulator